GPAMSAGGATATGKRSSKLGTGGPAYGFGPGDGGIPPEQRWSVNYPAGQSPEAYARQLDFFNVELAVPVGNTLVYGAHFSSPTPTRRVGLPSADMERLYFLERGQNRKPAQVALLRKAGIDVGDNAN